MKYNLNGKYPVKANWLVAKRTNADKVQVYNGMFRKTYELDRTTFRFLWMLDGNTDPKIIARRLKVNEKEVMRFLISREFVRMNGRKLKSGGSRLWTLYVPKCSKRRTILPNIYNMLLMVAWFPILLYGLYCALFGAYHLAGGYELVGSIMAVILGLVIHEFSHAQACLSYNGRLYEAGFLLFAGISPGAYVMIDDSQVNNDPLVHSQINAAGCQSNFFLAGLLLILSSKFPALSSACFCGAVSNIILGTVNLALISQLDGYAVATSLLGLGDDIHSAIDLLRDCKARRCCRKDTPNRVAISVACVILIVYQVMLPLLLLSNLLSVIGVFFL